MSTPRNSAGDRPAVLSARVDPAGAHGQPVDGGVSHRAAATHRQPGARRRRHQLVDLAVAASRRLAGGGVVNRCAAATAWAGYLVFGIPAVLGVPALLETFDRFGARGALAAAPAATCAIAPALLWLRYTRHRPTSVVAGTAWGAAAVMVAAIYLVTPLWFWSGLVACVLVSEVARVAAAAVLAWICNAGGRLVPQASSGSAR